MARTQIEIASHLIYQCIGDDCDCCDWSDEDRIALNSMSLAEADRLTCEVTPIAPARCDDADCYCCDGDDAEIEPLAEDYNDDDGMTDAEADADALASAGWGTDEDYGYFGGDD